MKRLLGIGVRHGVKGQAMPLLRVTLMLLALFTPAALRPERASGQQLNTAPSIVVAPGGTCLGDFRGRINLLLHDPDGSTSDLTLSARSSNTSLVPNENITFGGSGSYRTVTIEAASGKSGEVEIVIHIRPMNLTITVIVDIGTSNADTLNGTSNPDLLFGGGRSDTLRGGEGMDLLCGGSGDDTLEGGNGQDTLDGGANNDTLRGGYGADRLSGGSGSDRFDSGPDNDIATDFNTAEGDSKQSIP